MSYLGIARQDREIRELFPDFRLKFNLDFMGMWEGTLTPIAQTYRIQIWYVPWNLMENCIIANPSVSIIVIDPPIGRDPRGTGEPPQHVYALDRDPDFPALCVFDPVAREWTPEHSIATVLMPMIIKWLFFHEVWVDTGEWRGGGRHPALPPVTDEKQCQSNATQNSEGRAGRARSLNAEFHNLGRKIGVFGSYLSMGAGYPAFSRRRFSPSSNNASVMATTSESISTSSPAPRPEAFLRLGWAPGSPPANSSTSTLCGVSRFSQNAQGHSEAA